MQPALTISLLQNSYRDGTLTPRRVAEEIVRRAEQTADYNIWISPPDLERMEPYLARLEQLPPDSLPLWGVPFAVKDNIDVAGYPTTAACPAYTYTPENSAFVVQQLVEAGGFPVGKTNLDQFATGLVGTRSPYGETHNALKPELISGGSSAGSAVCVALGQAAFALGTDTAGSGRVPALLNGLYGYKPACGAWSTGGVVPACASLDCVTVFANTLGDCDLVDRTVRGVDAACCWSKPVSRPAAVNPKKVLVPESPVFYGDYADGYRRAWEQTLEGLRAGGMIVETVETQLFSEAASILYDGPWVAERWADLGPFVTSHPDEVLPVTRTILSSGGRPELNAASVFTASHRLQTLRAQAHRLLADSVLLMPTAGGTFTRRQVQADPIGTNSQMGLYTNHCNLLDLAAFAVPAGQAAPDVPFGVTVFAPSGREELLFGAAGWLEKTRRTTLAVCGLHMRGYALSQQLISLGGKYEQTVRTAPAYRLYRLPSVPPKPGLVRSRDGVSVELELWTIPQQNLGRLLETIQKPLGLGRIQLESGREAIGFLCESCAAETAEDITAYGGWRYTPLQNE